MLGACAPLDAKLSSGATSFIGDVSTLQMVCPAIVGNDWTQLNALKIKMNTAP